MHGAKNAGGMYEGLHAAELGRARRRQRGCIPVVAASIGAIDGHILSIVVFHGEMANVRVRGQRCVCEWEGVSECRCSCYCGNKQ